MNPFEKRLAEAIRGHPHLYDHSLRDSQKAQTSWREIADSLDTSEEKVRLKWKNIRDKFSKAKKRMAQRNGGLANMEEKPLRLPLIYTQLAWLCQHVKLMDEVSLPMSNDWDDEPDQQSSSGASWPRERAARRAGSMPQAALPMSNDDWDEVQVQQSSRDIMRDTEVNVAEAEALKRRDEDELFLLSLLPSLKRLTIKKRMEVRMKFQQVLFQAEFNE